MNLKKIQKIALGLMLTTVSSPTYSMQAFQKALLERAGVPTQRLAPEDVDHILQNSTLLEAVQEAPQIDPLDVVVEHRQDPTLSKTQIIDNADGGRKAVALGLVGQPQDATVDHKTIIRALQRAGLPTNQRNLYNTTAHMKANADYDDQDLQDPSTILAYYVSMEINHVPNPQKVAHTDGIVANIDAERQRQQAFRPGFDPSIAQIAEGIRINGLHGNPIATEDQISAGLAFIAVGHAAPVIAEIDGWVADAATRAERVLVAAEGMDSTDADLIAAATRCVAEGIANPTADQLNGTAAFIAGGHAAPTQAEIDGWVNNNATRAERVLVAAEGMDSTNAGLIVAATQCVAEGIANPSAEQLNGTVAFISAGQAAPTQAEIDGWVADAATRAERVLVAAAGLDSTDAALIAAATQCVAVGIANPTADQLNATAAFIAGGHAAPTQAEIDAWVNNNATRAERILVAAAGLDSTDADLIAAATRCVAAHIANPTADQLNGTAAFIAGGHAAPTQAEIDGWVGDAATRAQRVLVAAVNLDGADAALIAAATQCVAVGIANPTADEINASAFLMAPQHGAAPILAPTLDQIQAVVSVPAGEAAMRVELAWGIQNGYGAKLAGNIPVVAKVVAVENGYHEFEMIRTKADNQVRSGGATNRLLATDGSGNADPDGNRFRVADANVTVPNHAVDDVVVFDKLNANGPGLVQMTELAQH